MGRGQFQWVFRFSFVFLNTGQIWGGLPQVVNVVLAKPIGDDQYSAPPLILISSTRQMLAVPIVTDPFGPTEPCRLTS
jgi:hypothetical protein